MSAYDRAREFLAATADMPAYAAACDLSNLDIAYARGLGYARAMLGELLDLADEQAEASA